MKMKQSLYIMVYPALVWFLSGCSEHPTHTHNVPATYDTTGYTISTIQEQVLITQHLEFVSLLKTARNTSVTLALDNVIPKMEQVMVHGSQSLNDQWNSSIRELCKSSGKTYNPFDSVQNEGGTFGGYLFDENGMEQEQLLDKSAFVGVFFRLAKQIELKNEMPHKYIALFGATPAFVNSDITSNNRDRLTAAYAARRDKNDGRGLYIGFKNVVTSLQGHISSGTSHNDMSLTDKQTIFLLWEKAIMATVVNYCLTAYDKFTMTNPSEQDLGAGLHAVCEAIGFMKGLEFVDDKSIKTTQLESLFTLLQVSKPSVFVTNAFATVPSLKAAVQNIQSIYGFSDQEIQDFKMNWVIVQNRQ
ncbi:MAG: hypothetical protein ACK5DB_03210 [Ignavibacteria bacterium]